MVSNVLKISRDETCLSGVLDEIEKVAEYNGLEEKQALRLRLLSEELVNMLPELVDDFAGSFWVENKGRDYELHALVKAEVMNQAIKDEIIAVSKSGKNAAAVGILGMIRSAVEDWFNYANCAGAPIPIGFGTGVYGNYDYAWSMDLYMQQIEVRERKMKWDGLEKSIIASFSDDVIVGVKGRQIEVIVKKSVDAK